MKMASPGDWLLGPFGQLAMGGIGTAMQTGMYNQAQAANLRRDVETRELQRMLGQRAVGEYGQLGQQVSAGYGGLGQGASDFYGGLRESSRAGWGDLRSAGQQGWNQMQQGVMGGYGQAAGTSGAGYAERYKTGMGMLEGAGQQELADIQQQYVELGGQQQAELMRRGMGGTSVGGNLATQRARGLAGSLGRAKERLRGQEMEWHAGLSGEQLAAQDYWAQGRLGARERLGVQGYGQDMALRMGQFQSGQDIQQRSYDALQGYREAGLLGNLGYGEAAQQARWQSGQNMIGQIYGREDPYPSMDAWGNMTQSLGQLAAAREAAKAGEDQGGGMDWLGPALLAGDIAGSAMFGYPMTGLGALGDITAGYGISSLFKRRR